MVKRKLEQRLTIDVTLVTNLIAAQFPQWSDLPITPVEPGGVDNRTFRLGQELAVRLPSATGYAPQVEKEHQWLPVLAAQLPLPIPVPVAKGLPDVKYPFNWSVYHWIDGETARPERINDLSLFAVKLADFLRALQTIDSTGGPLAGAHSFYRGASLAIYGDETLAAIETLAGQIDVDRVRAVWEAARAATWHGSPVWFHGDVAADNLLTRNGNLAAVIDFGCSGVGDPACDLTIAWTLFSGESREAFRSALSADAAMWARARGWALWKALITLAYHGDSRPVETAAREVLNEVLADDEASRRRVGDEPHEAGP